MNLFLKRKEAGLTQDQVAKELNVAKNTISQWENCKREPDIKTLLMLSKLYNTSIDELLDNTNFVVKVNASNNLIIPDEKKETVQQLLALPEKLFVFISGEIKAYYQASQLQ